VNSEGQIEFPGGALLVGEGGPIEVGSGGDIQIGQDGTVQVDGNLVGTIVPVSVPDVSQLEKVGSSVFAVPNGVDVQPVTKARIQQGFLEASNVDIVREMIDMIISFRNYEADSKSVQVQDQTLDNLFNRVAPRS
jgi:flagellar basal-body rod protein FlgG